MRAFNANDLLNPEDIGEGKYPKFVAFSCYAVSTTAVVAAITGKRIRVHGLFMGVASAGSFALYAGGSVIAGLGFLAANGNLNLPFSPYGWCQTSHGQALNLFETAAATVTGVLIYVEV